jgi:hypothetical protein
MAIASEVSLPDRLLKFRLRRKNRILPIAALYR